MNFTDPEIFRVSSNRKIEYVASYATCNAFVGAVAEKDIKCITCSISDHYDSIYSQLYSNTAYVSLLLEIESGEVLYLEQYENDNSVYCATAELSTDIVDDLDPDDVIIDFQSVHMIFQHIPKYRVEFNPSQAWKSSVVFEKYNKDPMIEKAEQRTQEREEANE